MQKDAIGFEDFLRDVHPAQAGYVRETHGRLLRQGCGYKIETAKNGYVFSYLFGKKAVANYVFRKSGLIIRIYGEHIGQYAEILETLPQGMVRAIEKAPVCRRLLDPTKCNSRCGMGYVFDLGGIVQKKCRYGGFMFAVIDENHAAIQAFLQRELEARTA